MKPSQPLARIVLPGARTLGRVAHAVAKPAKRPEPKLATSTSMRVLGIDPGTTRLGYGLVERTGAGRLSYVECGVITALASQSRVQRLGVIAASLRDLIQELRPSAVAIEEAFFGKNVQSTLALGEARGVSICVASQAGVPIAGYSPALVKNTVAGSGRATKTQIAYVVRALLGLRRAPEPDAADALAIAICHARSFDFANCLAAAGAVKRRK